MMSGQSVRPKSLASPAEATKGFDRRAEAESSYLRFIANQGIQNQRRYKNYYIIPLLIIVIALISYVIV